MLDTRDLTIEGAAIIDGKRETPVPFVTGKKTDFRGAKLEISVPHSAPSK